MSVVSAARVGGLAGRIGPRLPMTVRVWWPRAGCCCLPAGRAGRDMAHRRPARRASWDRHDADGLRSPRPSSTRRPTGSPFGVNNAVARAAGLLAVAIIPGIAGVTGQHLRRPGRARRGFHTSMMVRGGAARRGRRHVFAFVRPASAQAGAPERVRVKRGTCRCERAAAAYPADDRRRRCCAPQAPLSRPAGPRPSAPSGVMGLVGTGECARRRGGRPRRGARSGGRARRGGIPATRGRRSAGRWRRRCQHQ